MEIILAKFVFLLSEEKRDGIKSFWRKIQLRKSNRGLKRSNEEAETFANLQMALLKSGSLEEN